MSSGPPGFPTLSITTMDYSSEPLHSSHLNIQGSEPFNAEPTAASLVEFNITPEDLVYCRNHGPVREFDQSNYFITIKSAKGVISLAMNDLKTNFTIHRVVAAVQVRTISSLYTKLSTNWFVFPVVRGFAKE